MSGIANYLENAILDHVFRGRAYTGPTDLYFALFTSAPSDVGGGTEVSGGNYSRVQKTANDETFTNTQGTTSGASTGTGATISNGVVIQFPTPSAAWGLVTHVAVLDSSGNYLLHGTLAVPRDIATSDDVKFAIGTLVFKLDD